MSEETKGLVTTKSGALATVATTNPLIARGLCDLAESQSKMFLLEKPQVSDDKQFDPDTLPPVLRRLYEATKNRVAYQIKHGHPISRSHLPPEIR